MARRKRENKNRPSFGLPVGVLLLATPEGWRHSVLTAEGGMLCGSLQDLPVHCDPGEARSATAAMVVGLARDFHGAEVEVAWKPPREPWSWSADVTVTSASNHPDGEGS
ncbi:hypothetical protein [Streptomyces gardneri]|uniref:hypothetical protein n=1 Tax=Streptomyces gardneri TaxID=66892 RepID=UPI0033C53CF3